MLNVAIKAARAAGALINRASLDVEAVRISQKQSNDFVTEVDHAAEQAIIETLLTAYPQHGILAEESGRERGNPGSDFLWIIDPLDGTTNFIHGLPHYCISIALMERGVITQALIFDPNRNELFTATRGRGAFLNDRRIRASKRSLLRFVLDAHQQGKRIAAYGAPAKAATLLNYAGVRSDYIEYTVDRNPHKQNHFLPGTQIPIYGPERILETKPDYLVILAWNLKDEVMKQMSAIREWGGRFVILVPEVQIYD